MTRPAGRAAALLALLCGPLRLASGVGVVRLERVATHGQLAVDASPKIGRAETDAEPPETSTPANEGRGGEAARDSEEDAFGLLQNSFVASAVSESQPFVDDEEDVEEPASEAVDRAVGAKPRVPDGPEKMESAPAASGLLQHAFTSSGAEQAEIGEQLAAAAVGAKPRVPDGLEKMESAPGASGLLQHASGAEQVGSKSGPVLEDAEIGDQLAEEPAGTELRAPDGPAKMESAPGSSVAAAAGGAELRAPDGSAKMESAPGASGLLQHAVTSGGVEQAGSRSRPGLEDTEIGEQLAAAVARAELRVPDGPAAMNATAMDASTLPAEVRHSHGNTETADWQQEYPGAPAAQRPRARPPQVRSHERGQRLAAAALVAAGLLLAALGIMAA